MSTHVLDRARLMLRRDGVRGSLRRAAKRAAGYVALREHHVWLMVDLQADRPKPRLAPELTLMRPGSSDLQLLGQLTTVMSREAATRIAAGNDLWIVLGDDRVLFSLWVFRDRTPAIAAPGGLLTLPGDTVCIEDIEVVPAARGRGLAPAAYAAILDAVSAEGARWVLIKVAADNAPSLRAAEKAGFQPVARMHFGRVGTRSRTSLEPSDGPLASLFAERVGPGLIDRHT
jgi:RimJ/RimL family protein N-acetyltransferase